MMIEISHVGRLSDRDLLAQVHLAAARERDATVQLIALLMELDTRRLYLAEGCASLFTYCMQILHLSEHAAYHRIEAARAARRFPTILARLADGSLNLTAVGLLAPHLTAQNHIEVLDAAREKSKRQVEELVARLRPRPDVPTVIRKLPAPKGLPVLRQQLQVETCNTKPLVPCEPSIALEPTRPAEVKALAPERYKIQFTVNRETHDKLRRAQDLLRHTIPNGDPAAIFEKALTLLLKELSKTKQGAADRPRPAQPAAVTAQTSRHIPAAVKRAVWRRDGGLCAFIGSQGRCAETGFLEFHHVVPYAAGGETTITNLELRCRAHNAHEAEMYFGARRPPIVREDCTRYGLELATGSGPSGRENPNYAVTPSSPQPRVRTNNTLICDGSENRWRSEIGRILVASSP